MDTLRLVEVTAEGDLVLMTGDGRRFSLSVDEQVRSAVRRSRNGTHVAPVSDRPGPREVQARIRAGADAEQVAQQTGLDVDYVRRFEGPVLAERAHVAELAQATAVDRGGDPTLTLERIVLDVLTGEGHDVDDISWDSRRSDGTRWEVVVASTDGAARTRATWAFDTSTRSLEPVDSEAERLTGVERRRRLSAVRDTVFDVERPSAAAPRGGTVDLLDALARQRGRRPAPATAPEDAGTPAADRGTADDAGTSAPDGSGDGSDLEEATGHTAAPLDPTGTSEDGTDETSDGDDTDDTDGRDDRSGREADAPAAVATVVADGDRSVEPDLLSELDLDRDAQPVRTTASSRTAEPGRTAQPSRTPVRATPVAASDRSSRRRRSAVPSWDEIVFGAKREGGG